MKDVTLSYHNQTEPGDQLTLVLDDSAQVTVLDARSIGGDSTRWQFVVTTERVNRSMETPRRWPVGN